MRSVSRIVLTAAATAAASQVSFGADLPSRKASPASYVRVCDAYGAGFFYIPGTDTCLRVGGYVRAEYQFTPAHNVYVYSATKTAAAYAVPDQVAGSLSTSGMEMRGRVDLDARTQTPWGTARTFIRLRMLNNSGIRNFAQVNNAVYANSSGANTAPGIESALVQWAGFTFGVAPENYAFMPGFMFYHGNAWTGFPNGMSQLAYTATFGGGLSATIAIEDRATWAYAPATTVVSQPTTGQNIVANIRWDQPWGWAIIHGVAGYNSTASTYPTSGVAPAPLAGINVVNVPTAGTSRYGAWAIGTTWMFNLPFLGSGDRLWLSANYTQGMLGSVLAVSGLSNLSNAAGGRQLGGIGRIDTNLVVTGGAGTAAVPFTIGSTKAWNIGAILVHNWTANWRSQLKSGYVEINPPTSTLTQWGKGRAWEVTHGLIFSPKKDLDIGFEVQYLNIASRIQNPSAAFVAAGSPGLKDSGWSSKLRFEHTF